MTNENEDREYLLVTVTLDDMLPHTWRSEGDAPCDAAESGNYLALSQEVAETYRSMYELTRLQISVHTEQDVLVGITFLDDEGSIQIDYNGHPPPPYYVAVWDTDKAWGGPEEGGWWYATGTRVLEEVYDTEEEANAAVERLREEYPSNGSSSSVLGGREDYQVWVSKEPNPEFFPSERPHYE